MRSRPRDREPRSHHREVPSLSPALVLRLPVTALDFLMVSELSLERGGGLWILPIPESLY